VARITATALSPSSLVAAYRVLPEPSAAPGQASRELSAVWMGVRGGELVVSAHSLALEPGRVGAWARDVALVSQDLFAYSYQAGPERQTKLALVRVDPETHQMAVTSGPTVIGHGDATSVRGISLPSGPASPRTFTYFQRPSENAMAEVCNVSPDGRITDCRDVMWADTETRAASGVRLPDGRLAFAFANKAGAPFYQLLSGSESGVQDA